ncbi:MAG: YrdB family protein [Anaerolineales bacterium]|nr:YrdB family protein [Anaerolineales bacterium]
MEAFKLFNIGLRFLLELCILGIFGYWGFKTGSNVFMKFLLGIGSPILFAVVWGTFLAPKSSLRLDEPWLFLLELVVFGLTCWALYSTGKVDLTVAFGGIYIFNKILMVIWRQ